MGEFFKRTWAQIDVDALCDNLAEIRKIVGKTVKIMAIVKADAYGHGVKAVAETLLDAGADCLGVSCINEAMEIRNLGIKEQILILGYTSPEDYETAVKNDITMTLFSVKDAQMLSAAAKKVGKNALVHIKLNVGMNRLGFDTESDESLEEIAHIMKTENITVDGIFTHFPCADEDKDEITLAQFEKYKSFVGKVENMCGKIPVHHVCNSAACIKFKQMHLDMVRAGIILYGLFPSSEMDKTLVKLKPAMSIKTVVSRIQWVCKGEKISYGGTYCADKPMKIATIPIGYADGYTRLLSNKGRVIVGGCYANIVGKICMDQCMIDVTDVNNISVGDEVTVMGSVGEKTVGADDIADIIGTINYEFICMVGKRVPRVYLKKGKITDVFNQLV